MMRSYKKEKNLKRFVLKECEIKYRLKEKIQTNKIKTPQDVYKIFGEKLNLIGEPQEQIIAVYLNIKNEIIAYNVNAKGNYNCSIICVPLMIKYAILLDAPRIIMVHNHPSGDPTPSDEDKETFKKLKEACSLLGFECLDSVVVGYKKCYSLASNLLFEIN
jgi:DNA repair protein RadC